MTNIQKKVSSIRDVAQLAGVSLGSASKALNGVAGVSADVRQRVVDAAAQLGYQPNQAARALRSRTSKTVGCLFTDVENPLYARTYRVLEEKLRSAGYVLFLANGLNDAAREIDILNTFQSRGMDGVVIAPGNERNLGVLNAIDHLRMPLVIYDRDIDVGADRILFDHEDGVQRATKHLLDLAHTRIALVLWSQDTRPVRGRMAGYESAYAAAGIASPRLIVQEETATSSAYDSVVKLLESDSPPTAFLAQGTRILVSTLRAISAKGLRVPQDVSVIAIGDTDFAQTYAPPITVLRTPTDKVAGMAASLLLERMGAGREGAAAFQSHTVAYEFVQRESTARR